MLAFHERKIFFPPFSSGCSLAFRILKFSFRTQFHSLIFLKVDDDDAEEFLDGDEANAECVYCMRAQKSFENCKMSILNNSQKEWKGEEKILINIFDTFDSFY